MGVPVNNKPSKALWLQQPFHRLSHSWSGPGSAVWGSLRVSQTFGVRWRLELESSSHHLYPSYGPDASAEIMLPKSWPSTSMPKEIEAKVLEEREEYLYFFARQRGNTAIETVPPWRKQ